MNIFQNKNTQLGTVAAISVGAILSAYALNHYRKKYNYWNSSFVEAGRVDRLFVYPIKSCKGVEISFLDCTSLGVRNGWLSDREFLVIDELHDGMFLTARTYPKLVLIEADRDSNNLIVKFPNGRRVEVDLVEVKRKNEVRKALLHEGLRTDGLDCGDEIGQAFTEFLGVEGKRSLRLLQFSVGLFTERDPKSDQNLWLNPVPDIKANITFEDDACFMINSKASLIDLNEKLVKDGLKPVDIRNFRPVIYISETLPFEEDLWLEVRIGDAELVCYRPCTRCILTTVDPDEGTLDKGMQPLKKLREYRLAPGSLRKEFNLSPVFGVYLALRRPGRIRVGDTVFVRRKPSPF